MILKQELVAINMHLNNFVVNNNNNDLFIADWWFTSQAQSNNTSAQKMVSHSALQNRCLHTTNTGRSKTL